MSTGFNLYLHLHRQQRLDHFIPWRAYDIPSAIKPRHVEAALKELGFKYAGELALSHFKAKYEITDAEPVNVILGGWWLLRLIEGGGHPRVPLRSKRLPPQPEGGLPPPQATEIDPGGGGQSGA